MNLLAMDIGNTNITIGLFQNGKLIRKSKSSTYAYSLYGKVFGRCAFDAAVISSVVPLGLCRALSYLNRSSGAPVYVVGRDIEVPIKNLYRDKKTLGQDRLVNAFAAKRLYGSPAVVIDFGTAVTFDIVSRKGDYLGGLITPGMEMSLGSLYNKTALLPRVALKTTRDIIGKDTAGCMRAGVLFGFGAMCDGLVAKYKRILGKDTVVVATGGNANLITRYTGSIQKVDEDLALKGLCLISLS